MPVFTNHRARLLASSAFLAAMMAVAPAQAGRLEEAFKAFLEQLRGDARAELQSHRPAALVEARVPELATRVDSLPLGRREYVVFVAPGCRGCRAAQAYFAAEGMSIEALDVTRSPTAREALALTRAEGLPVVLVGRYRLTGWNERLFLQALRQDFQDTMQKVQGDGA